MAIEEKKIQLRLKMLKKGLTWKKLSEELGVGESAVRVIFHSKSQRIQDFLTKRLRLPKDFWDDIEYGKKKGAASN